MIHVQQIIFFEYVHISALQHASTALPNLCVQQIL